MDMTDEEILAALSKIIYEVAEIPAAEITPERRFAEDDLDVDSLALVEMAQIVQDDLKVKVPDEAIKNLKTVQDVIDHIRHAEVLS